MQDWRTQLGEAHRKETQFRLPSLALAVLLFFVESSLVAGSGLRTPPFVAGGTISALVLTGDGAVVGRTDGTFSFVWSNGFWQADASYTSPARMAGSRVSCKTIPDGIRFFTALPTNPNEEKTTVLAHALAQEFPPIEQPFPFVCWLALTPKPSLPLLGAREMRRFVFQQDMNHPENGGTFGASYLPPSEEFLSHLTITNNGVLFQVGGQPTRFRGPYAAGFLENEYQVLDTTNVGGAVFPLRSVFRRFAPKPGSTGGELYTTSEARLLVSAIEILSEAPSAKVVPESPSRLLAADSRPPGLAKDLAMNHIVTNDQWLPITNRELAELAKIYRNMRQNRGRTHLGYTAVFLGLAVIAPAAAFVVGKRRNRKKE